MQPSDPLSPRLGRPAVPGARRSEAFWRSLKGLGAALARNGWSQLAFGELLCVGGAALLFYFWAGTWPNPPLINTAIGAAVAFFFCQLIHHRLERFPGEIAFSQIAPLFLGVAGLVIGVFVVTRLPYSLGLGAVAGCLSIGWFLALSRVVRRLKVATVGLLPFGSAVDASWVPAHFRRRPIVSVDDRAPDCDFIVADLHYDLAPEWQDYIANATLAGQPILHVQNAKESLTGRVQIRHLSENPVGALLPPPGYMFAKRMIDFALVVTTLPVTLPLLLAGWIAVTSEGSGTAFYRQVRVGYRGRTFVIHKLRTMRDSPGATVTEDSDLRITPVGRLLRRYHIDELPQILNILKGEMSWIGPRPDVTERLAEYRKAIPFFAYRHVVRPGITGWAQVNQGYAESIDEISRKLEYDFFYIRNISFWLDILILMKSLRIVIRGIGAR